MLQFRDVKQSYPIYILDKQNFSYTEGRVVSNTFPHIDNTNPMTMGKMVVDLVIEAGDKSATYIVPENLCISSSGDIILATDKNGIISELEAIKNKAEQYLKERPKVEKDLEESSKLLMELNPVLKEKQETEKRFSQIETSVREMKDMLQTQQEMFEKVLKNFNPKE